MEKTYFIHRSVNNNIKNKLDAKLHEEFAKFQHKTISEDNLFILDVLYENVVAAYKDTGGRCQPEGYSRYKPPYYSADDDQCIYVHITESLSYILHPICGKVEKI